MTVTEAMGKLGVEASVAKLVQEIGRSGLGSETEVALLKTGRAQPRLLDEATFTRAFAEVIEDEYAEIGPELLGEQARAVLLAILSGRSPHPNGSCTRVASWPAPRQRVSRRLRRCLCC